VRTFSEWPLRLATILLAVAALYALSIGPVAVWTQKHNYSPPALETFYQPLGWLYDKTFVAPWIDAYVELWGAE
jgi:hypothetical protein